MEKKWDTNYQAFDSKVLKTMKTYNLKYAISYSSWIYSIMGNL